jgi:hypothetical protein
VAPALLPVMVFVALLPVTVFKGLQESGANKKLWSAAALACDFQCRGISGIEFNESNLEAKLKANG